jgi:Flp pilus assembly protein CpaB
VAVIGLLITFVGLGTVGVLATTGLVRFPWQHRKIEPVAPGMVRVWEAARRIPAFARVTEEYLVDDKTGFGKYQDVPEGKVPQDVIRSVDEILQRVMAHDKAPGFVFTERDFLPKGTLPGLVAGIPPGKRALTLDAVKLRGIDLLQTGDRFDLLAAVPVDRLLSTGDRDQAWRPGNPLPSNTKTASSNSKQTETHMLARDAVIITPLATRARPVTSQSLMQGTTVRTVPVQEVVVAVNREDAAGVTEAVEMGVEIITIARSGQPNAEDSVAAPAGMVAVPVATRWILAYSEIVHDDLFDVRTRDLRYIRLPTEEVRARGIVTDADELLGRVVARDRGAGQFILRADLLPPGTSPGLTAGVPPGKRSFAIAADKLAGARGLQHGDHFDLLVGIPLGLDKNLAGGLGWLPTSSPDGVELRLEKQAEIRVVAQDAVVVSPVLTPKFAPTAASMTASKDMADSMEKSAEEIVIAVAADEVDRLAEALTLGLKLTAVSRSGIVRPNVASSEQPTTAEKPLTDLRPLANVRMIETLNGKKRQTFMYSAPAQAE